jgi:hypothetical protein
MHFVETTEIGVNEKYFHSRWNIAHHSLAKNS